MRGGRLFIIVGLVVLVGAAAAGFVLMRRSQQPSAPVSEVGEGTPGPEFAVAMTDVVVAVQDVPRGMRITGDVDAVGLEAWPEDAVPDGAIAEVGAVYGRISRVDIARGMPVLDSMLTEAPGDIAVAGSDAALQIPRGKVGYALPVARYSSIAWALEPGDHVDVLVSLLVVDLDEEFQSILPNQATCVSPSEEEGCQGGVMGRLEVLPNNWVVNVRPGEAQRPRLVTQMTIQDAMVLRVGDWEEEEEAPRAEGEEAEEEGAEPTPAPPPRAEVEPLTLAVSPQDAMVLKYAQEVGANVDLVLRSAGDTGPVTTESVTLRYLFSRFSIELPPKLPYGVTPPLQSLGPGAAGGAEGGGEAGE